MNIGRFVSLVLGLMMLLAVAGCSDTAVGGVLGAGGGALVGSAVGHPLAGALIGGIGGAAVGYGISHSSHTQPHPPPAAYDPYYYGPRSYY
jgi:hypothetical protein